MTYCRILLPQLLGVPRLIYLDCDLLVFRDLTEPFDLQLSPGKLIAAVPTPKHPPSQMTRRVGKSDEASGRRRLL